MKKLELQQIIREEITKVLSENEIEFTSWPADTLMWPKTLVISYRDKKYELKKIGNFEYVLDNNKWRRPKPGERVSKKTKLPAYQMKSGTVVDFYNIDFVKKEIMPGAEIL